MASSRPSKSSPSTPTGTVDSLFHKLEDFCQNPSTRPLDLSHLSKYLDARPTTAPIQSALPIDEMEERLALCNRTLAALKKEAPSSNPELSKFGVSILLCLPMDAVRSIDREMNCSSPVTFLKVEHEIVHLVKIFLQWSLPGNKDDESTTGNSRPFYANKNRNKSEATKCSERDRDQCVLCGTLNPERCHCFPFAANSSDAKVFSLMTYKDTLKRLLPDNDDDQLLLGGAACSDKAWNMLCLNRQLHDWWGRGFFALKCLGITPEEACGANVMTSHTRTPRGIVRIQFHWMPRQQVSSAGSKLKEHQWMGGVSNDQHETWVQAQLSRTCYGSPSTSSGSTNGDDDDGVVAAVNVKTGRLVQTGDVFTVTLPSLEDAAKMKAMLDVQWACINIASMAGAAGDPAFLREDWEDSDSDEEVVEEEDAYDAASVGRS